MQFGEIVRREYRAIGPTAALHPQIDRATHPRWTRQLQTFGQDPKQVSVFVRAYLPGLQGEELGAHSVAGTAKHSREAGAKGRRGPHFPTAGSRSTPAANFDDHLRPFVAAIESGVSGIMPYYGMPIALTWDGIPVEEVAFGFNRTMITRLLRERLEYDGVVLTDWAILTDIEVGGLPWAAKAWGVEHLDRASARCSRSRLESISSEERRPSTCCRASSRPGDCPRVASTSRSDAYAR